ncbi:hypothetical protein SGRIM128S_03825 [Streptomyces griseomycini]
MPVRGTRRPFGETRDRHPAGTPLRRVLPGDRPVDVTVGPCGAVPLGEEGPGPGTEEVPPVLRAPVTRRR